MGITNTPDMNHNNDIYTSHIEQKQSWQSGFENGLEDINSKLALQWLKLELPKTQEQEEKEVLELVKQKGLKKSFENNRFSEGVSINKIQNGIFWVVSNKTWNVNYFVNEQWWIIFWLSNIRERPFVYNGKAFEEAGYREKKENWKNNLYKVSWGEYIRPIDINTIEYYQAWKNIIFYDDVYTKLLELEKSIKNTKEDIILYIKYGSFKVEDLETFKEKWMIDEEIFQYGLTQLRKILPEQCTDERLISLWVWIKESDIKRYLEKWYIDEKLALDCYNKLPKDMRNLSGK